MLFFVIASYPRPAASDVTGSAIVLNLRGTVNPATADYISRGLQKAAQRKANIIVLQIDTPGGLDSSTRDIVRSILASPIAVIAFVTPSGARAASAGTYILYASHLAAMSPGTHLGAATPVAIGGGSPFNSEPEDGGDASKQANKDNANKPVQFPKTASEAKAINDSVAYIRGLAELRNRNADWAEKAVREAAALSSDAAMRANVIDFMAATIDDLLKQADGRTVRVGQENIKLNTTDLMVETLEPDWRARFLSTITDPNIALILMMIGIYGLIFEFLNPGALVPGTVGAISLIVGLYALAVLPVNYAGLGLIALGSVLLVAEAFAPSFGILGIGGSGALVLGAIVLLDTDIPGLEISRPIIGGIAVASLVFSVVVARLALLVRRKRAVTGAEEMISSTGEVESWAGSDGYIIVHGERWRATSPAPLSAGDRVTVTNRHGLTLEVALRQRKRG